MWDCLQTRLLDSLYYFWISEHVTLELIWLHRLLTVAKIMYWQIEEHQKDAGNPIHLKAYSYSKVNRRSKRKIKKFDMILVAIKKSNSWKSNLYQIRLLNKKDGHFLRLDSNTDRVTLKNTFVYYFSLDLIQIRLKL